ncbi:MAG: type II toxin-antitoxin system RelE/ParE family toxin [Dehalococcoidia bacterium]|nr:type II toxin-antitoxin system RelE/ParE family toxin [Dehalococcoidia bacterium]
MYRLLFSPKARRAFLELRIEDAQSVKAALDRLQENPRRRGVVALHDLRIATYRFRVGWYRVLFDINDRDQTLSVLDIRRRNERTYR